MNPVEGVTGVMNHALKPKTHSITDDYLIGSHVLGLGISGKVVECFAKNGQKYALKVYPVASHVFFFQNVKLKLYFIDFSGVARQSESKKGNWTSLEGQSPFTHC